MIHSWLEDLFDSLLFGFLLVGSILFFGVYWSGCFQLRYAEVVIDSFLEKVASRGSFSAGEYEMLLTNLNYINNGFSVELLHTRQEQFPVYEKVEQDRLLQYYMERNIRRELVVETEKIDLSEEIDPDARLQEETNASILALEDGEYLPLPEEGNILSVSAVRSSQEVYVRENLITLCEVRSEKGNYYVEARQASADKTGRISLLLEIQGQEKEVWIDVICYPREVYCSNGHLLANTKKRIEQQKENGGITDCPFCKEIPESLECSRNPIYLTVGEDLEVEAFFTARYPDGHEESVRPGCTGWQDTYDSNYCGIQNVTVIYRGVQTEFTVISEGGICKNCGSRCSGRCYADYKTFPYCSACMAEVPLFTEHFYKDEVRTWNDGIIEVLWTTGCYAMDRGETIMIVLKNREKRIYVAEKNIRKRAIAEKIL